MSVTASKHPVRSPRRRASMYFMVLGTTLVVMAIGLAALNLARLARREATQGQDFLEARLYARSAIEIGLNLTLNTSNWRSTFPQGAWRSNLPLGRGTYSVDAIDTVDGNFANNQDDMLLMTGKGVIGGVQYKLAVSAAPYGPKGLSCLASAIHAGTVLTNNSTLTPSALVSANGNVGNSALCTINSAVEAGGFITNLGNITGTTTPLATAKEMPLSTVFDYYIANGTTIPFASISGGDMRRKVLTPTFNNVGGGTNAQGIYVISCGGATIRIRQCRIQGTLVLLDPGSSSTIEEEINWESASATLPALMVRGPMRFSWTGTLSESAAGSTNFNPTNAPYLGVTDSDTTDTYPGVMRGLVYVSGALTVSAAETIEGVVVTGGSVTNNAALTITHNSAIITSPPAGFEKVNRPMLPVAGTWQQLVN